jgi:hypothetical protein
VLDLVEGHGDLSVLTAKIPPPRAALHPFGPGSSWAGALPSVRRERGLV